jgi:membrane protein
LKGLIERLKRSLPGRLVTAYGESKAANYASGLAFNAFLSMFPLILGLLTIVGLLIHNPGLEQKLTGAIIGIFPPDAHDQLKQAFQGIKNHAGVLGIISILGLIWSGTGLFAAMEFALSQVFGTGQRNMLRQRAMGLVMMVVFMTGMILAAGANGIAGATLPLAPVSGFVIGSLIMVALLIMIYRFVPNRSFPFSQLWPGALLAGLLIEVLSLIFPIYGKLSHGFNTYGQQFALFFLLATWLFFLCQLLLLGAVFNRLRQGAPEEAGVAAEPGEKGEAAPRPVDAIEAQQNVGENDQAGAPAGKEERRSEPTRRR